MTFSLFISNAVRAVPAREYQSQWCIKDEEFISYELISNAARAVTASEYQSQWGIEDEELISNAVWTYQMQSEQ
jgi:hypothetical protein